MTTISKIITLVLLCLHVGLFAQTTIEGTWTSTYGDLRLHQMNKTVFGDYAGRGIIEGTYKDKVLEGTFTWLDANGKPIAGKTGKIRFTFNGTSFTGKWGWSALSNNWTGSRKSSTKPKLTTYKTGFRGIVTDKASGRKLTNARIAFAGQNGKTFFYTNTGSNGAYSILLPKDRYKVLVKSGGCRNYTIPGDGVSVISTPKMGTYNFFLECGTNNNTTNDNTNNTASNTPTFPLRAGGFKLVVLVHGITEEPSANQKKAENIEDNQHINEIQHNQYYWGFHFMRTLLGQTNKSANLYHWVNRSTQKTITKRGWDKHTVRVASTAMPNGKAPIFTAEKYTNHVAPKLGVMVTYRDGSRSLREQTEATIDQIYDSYDHYFGKLPKSKQPMLYMVCHSFGGLVMRTLISNPTTTINGGKLSAEHRKRADFIRDRIVLINTLATPHEGSAAFPHKERFANSIDKLAGDISKNLGSNAQNSFKVGDLTIKSWEVELVVGDLRKAAKDLRNEYKEPSVADIGAADTYNRSFLKPEFGTRTDGSRIPIYTMSGRNSGSWYFLTPVRKMDLLSNSINDMADHYSNFGANKIPEEGSNALLGEIIAKSYYKPGTSFWGRAINPEGDRFSVYQYSGSGTRLSSFVLNGLMGKGIGIDYKSDGIYDSDILVGWNSGHALKLGTNTMNYFDNKRKWGGKYGSWYRLYTADYGNSVYPWDFDNHRSYMYNEGIGAFIGSYLVKHAGPYVGASKFSKWKDGTTHPPLKNKKLQVCIKYIKDVDNSMDLGPDQADFVGYVQIGKYLSPKTATAKGKNELKPSSGNNCVWRWDAAVKGIVPVRIEIYDADSGAYGDDDEASISPKAYKHGLLFYVDVENGRVYGDVTGTVRSSITQPANFTVVGHTKSKRRVQVKFSIVLK